MREKGYSSRLSGAVSNSIVSFGDLFKDINRDGPKSVKFPEKLLKVLEQKLQNIAMGKDPAYVAAASQTPFWTDLATKLF